MTAGSPKWSSDGSKVVFYAMSVRGKYLAREMARGQTSNIVLGSTWPQVSAPFTPQVTQTQSFTAVRRTGPHRLHDEDPEKRDPYL